MKKEIISSYGCWRQNFMYIIARQQLLFFTIIVWKQHGRSKQLLTLCCSKDLMPTWISCLARSPTFTLPSRVRQHYGFQCLEPISSTLRTFNSEQMSTRRIYSSNSWPSSKTTCYLLTVAYNPPWGSCGCR